MPLCITVPQADRKEVCRKAGITVQVKRVAGDAGEGDETESEAKTSGGRGDERGAATEGHRVRRVLRNPQREWTPGEAGIGGEDE